MRKSEQARRLLGGIPLPLLGLAFCRAWSQWSIVLLAPDARLSSVAGHPLYDIGCLLGACLLMMTVSQIDDLSARKGSVVVATATMCISSVSMIVSRTSSTPVIGSIGAVFGGAAFLVMSVAWACLYVGFGPMRAVVMFCLERIVSEAVSFIMAGFIETYLIGSTLVLPLISLWCYRKSIAIASGQGNVQTPGGAGPIPLKPALFMLFYSVAYAVADAGAGVHLTYPASLFALVPPTLFIALIALWPKCFKVSTLYFVACPAMMAAVMLPATLSVSPPQLVRSCMEVSYSTAVITEFLIVAELSYRLGIQPVWFFSIVRAFRYGGLLIGSALVSIVSSSPMHSLVFSVLIVSGVVIVSLMLVGERGENPNWGIVSREVGSMPKGEALETRVVETAGLFGLSEREEQVLSRLMHHMTVAAISQELMLAPGTVKAHVQHIYRKTNCHSRKELESLVLGKRA